MWAGSSRTPASTGVRVHRFSHKAGQECGACIGTLCGRAWKGRFSQVQRFVSSLGQCGSWAASRDTYAMRQCLLSVGRQQPTAQCLLGFCHETVHHMVGAAGVAGVSTKAPVQGYEGLTAQSAYGEAGQSTVVRVVVCLRCFAARRISGWMVGAAQTREHADERCCPSCWCRFCPCARPPAVAGT